MRINLLITTAMVIGAGASLGVVLNLPAKVTFQDSNALVLVEMRTSIYPYPFPITRGQSAADALAKIGVSSVKEIYYHSGRERILWDALAPITTHSVFTIKLA